MEWLPIETAPRDSTRILIYCPEMDGPCESIAKFCFDENDKNKFILDTFPWVTDEGSLIAEREPTHWMPLPTPPKETRQCSPAS